MAEYLISDTTLTNIANAIRKKTGEAGVLTPAAMINAINLIPGGLEIVSTEAEMDNKLIADNTGKMYKYIGTTNNKYVPGDIYIIEEV
jgi:hypothetical protein